MKKNLNNLEEIKIENISTIFDLIRNNEEITRVMISDMTDFTRMSVTRIVNLLMDKGMVYEDGEISASRGRPAKKLHIKEDALYSFTVYIDVDRIIVAVVNLKNEIIIKDIIDANVLFSMEDYIDNIYEIYKEWEIKNQSIFKEIKCISFACPGIVNPMNGEIEIAAQLEWRNAKVSQYASNKFGRMVIVDNDVKSALLGEVSSLNNKDDTIIAHMCIGYGVGVGLWIDGKILRGAHNNAGEIGHISIDNNGQLCKCGRKGCLDTVLNIDSLITRARLYDDKINSVSDIYKEYLNKKKWALEIVDDASRYFSIAINNIVYAYNPNKIIVGGKLFDMFPGILEIMVSSQHFKTYSEYINKIQIESSNMGEDSYLIGGAINSQRCAFESIFFSS